MNTNLTNSPVSLAGTDLRDLTEAVAKLLGQDDDTFVRVREYAAAGLADPEAAALIFGMFAVLDGLEDAPALAPGTPQQDRGDLELAFAASIASALHEDVPAARLAADVAARFARHFSPPAARPRVLAWAARRARSQPPLPAPVRDSTRPRAPRQPGRRSPKTSRGPDDGGDPDPAADPVECWVRKVVARAPALSEGQQSLIRALLLGGGPR